MSSCVRLRVITIAVMALIGCRDEPRSGADPSTPEQIADDMRPTLTR